MEEKIRLASTPGESKKLGQSRKVTLRADWEQVPPVLRCIRLCVCGSSPTVS